MRDYQKELDLRVDFIRNVIKSAGASGIVYGNSGGKDSALVGILCKTACENTVGVIMPCGSKRNYNEDKADAQAVAKQFNIETRFADLTKIRDSFLETAEGLTNLSPAAISNIAPRLRMTTLYMVAASENRLVAGTGNRSEGYMGYFTKWGDAACDFNPIADLTVTEIYEFLRFLKAPSVVLEKAPSAGLFDGQTDEGEMGMSYKSIDSFLFGNAVSEKDRLIIEKHHNASEHKRKKPVTYVE
ncbi:MAG TPA: NAD(+) synthase [Eubacteriales bacterium]|nr:NAD(+) synthase [Clostridia bacterium]HRR90217.1 NAD(+) synthase [Eubacteriales bacterium]HRU84366.1 NAD(+) synthase [Eubacteriales bacterium]